MPCPICDDTRWKPVESDAAGGVRRVVRCECWQGEHTRRLFDEARIPARYRRCDFENFQVYPNEKLTNAVTAVRRFADAFPNSPKGLCLIGPHGIGKTHLAVAALRAALGRGCEGIFYEVSDLLRLIRSTYNPVTKTAEMDILQPLVSVQLLVLDDVGKEKTSEWVEETMTFIVNSRYNNRLTTIFTSNYEDNPDIEALDSLRVRVGSRMYSRMHEMCDFVDYGGADYRLLPPNGGVDDLIALWKVTGEQRGRLPSRSKGQVRAQLKHPGRAELGWSGGKAGS
jgi:DNA replication protein DnaC